MMCACVRATWGQVTQLILHRDEAGESKRFAFVTFADKESTTGCLEKLDGLEVAGKALAVSRIAIAIAILLPLIEPA